MNNSFPISEMDIRAGWIREWLPRDYLLESPDEEL